MHTCMSIGRHRARRVRDELRLWLRSRYGIRTAYSQAQIDRGARTLGLDGADDLMLAYTFFGGDLLPAGVDVAASIDPSALAAAFEDVTEPFDLLAPE